MVLERPSLVLFVDVVVVLVVVGKGLGVEVYGV